MSKLTQFYENENNYGQSYSMRILSINGTTEKELNQMLVDKLAEYENIGEPEELAKLKERVDVLERALDLMEDRICSYCITCQKEIGLCNKSKEYFKQQAVKEIKEERNNEK